MNEYFAVLFSDLESHSTEWSRVPRERMVSTIAEYRYMAESLAGQYGCHYREWAGDGHMFLFDSADAAAQFGLRLIESWRIGGEELPALRDLPRMPLRLGCHFGECTRLKVEEAWIGRGNAVAKRVEGEAEPDTLFVTESVLDLLDLPLYEFEEVGSRTLKGDSLAQRRLYRLVGFDHEALAPQAGERADGGGVVPAGVGFVGTEHENTEEEARCYEEALRLRPDYPEAHNNLAILREHFGAALGLRPDYVDAHHGFANLLRSRGDLHLAGDHFVETLRLRLDYPEAHNNYAIFLEDAGDHPRAAEHYREALRLRPEYPEAHYNYALLLESQGDPAGAEEHYRQALLFRSDYPEAHNNLAILLQAQGEASEAEEHYREALRLQPDAPETHYNYALLLRARGEAELAEQHFRTARELAPESDRFETSFER
jgi:Tfp pilus assembly protein PilF/class 3 adenylate cyclase